MSPFLNRKNQYEIIVENRMHLYGTERVQRFRAIIRLT